MCMKNKHKLYNERKKEVMPPSILFRMLKRKNDNELKNALKRCVIEILPRTLKKEEEELYNESQIKALKNEHTFIQENKSNCKTGLLNKYLDSFKTKIMNLEKENEDPVFRLKLREIKGNL
jgi:hypothetical protein